jgi:hypothetical protein
MNTSSQHSRRWQSLLGTGRAALAVSAAAAVLAVSGTGGTAGAGPIPALDPNLRFWLNAGDLDANPSTPNPADGTPVAQWGDGSGGQNDAVQASAGLQPTYQTGVINGEPTVQFVGSRSGGDQDFLDATFGTSVAQPYTAFVVGRINGNAPAGQAADYFFDGTNAGNRVAMLINGSGGNESQFGIYAGGPEAPATTWTRADWQQFHTYAAEFDGTPQIWIDGTSRTLDTTNLGANPITALRIGNRFTADTGLNGDIAEILVYDRVLSASERQSVESYLTAKYVPEPGSLGGLLVAGLGLLRRRKRTR